jgi:hypothetical protein
MIVELSKMSEDELFKRLAMLHNRRAWCGNMHYSNGLIPQIDLLIEEVTRELQERADKMYWDNHVLKQPDVITYTGYEEKKSPDENSNTRAKTKSDIIMRLRRSSEPTSGDS